MREGEARREGTCVSFDADVIRRLREEKERTGVPISRLVNKLLRAALVSADGQLEEPDNATTPLRL